MYVDFKREETIWRMNKKNIISQINQAGLPLVLFGKVSVVSPAFLKELSVPVQYICDNNPGKWGTQLWGLNVISPAQLHDLYQAYTVLILVPFEHQIVPQLQALPTPPSKIFRLDLYFEEDGSAEFFEKYKDDLEEIYAHLSDQVSKKTYEATVRYRINRDTRYLQDISLPRNEQYFPRSLEAGKTFLNSEEIFIDAGAFVGDTIETFCRAVHNKYRGIYAFEPESENYRQLLEKTSGLSNVFCEQTAVGEEKKTLHFISDDSSSKQDDTSAQTIPCDTLDQMLGNVPITYLKMDVEGMECPALRGAKQLIRAHHPKLAICTYHSNADMVMVPKLILTINPKYKLYFRHYTNALVETVCYAI